jgi:hypothetical protein
MKHAPNYLTKEGPTDRRFSTRHRFVRASVAINAARYPSIQKKGCRRCFDGVTRHLMCAHGQESTSGQSDAIVRLAPEADHVAQAIRRGFG